VVSTSQFVTSLRSVHFVAFSPYGRGRSHRLRDPRQPRTGTIAQCRMASLCVYFPMGAGEIFIYAMAYEAAFEVAPKEQKGDGIGL